MAFLYIIYHYYLHWRVGAGDSNNIQLCHLCLTISLSGQKKTVTAYVCVSVCVHLCVFVIVPVYLILCALWEGYWQLEKQQTEHQNV